MDKLIDLAKHIIVMEDDAYFLGHPEWPYIVDEAKRAIGVNSYRITFTYGSIRDEEVIIENVKNRKEAADKFNSMYKSEYYMIEEL